MRRWLLLSLFLCVGGGITKNVSGQVIIHERLELDRAMLTPQPAQTQPTGQAPLQSDFLIPVEFDQLLALADGTLLVDFTEAFTDQSVDFSADPLVVEIVRQGETLRHELLPADFLPEPLMVSTAGDFCQEQIYSSEPYLYTRITDNAVISRTESRPPFPSDISENAKVNPPLLSVSKTVDNDPDFFFSEEERSLLWLPALQTNGLATHAELVLRPSFNPIQPVVSPEAVSFPMLLYRAASPWTPEQVSWDTQPGVSDLVIVEENDLDTEQVEVTVDITSIGQFWVANPEQVYGLALYPEQFSGNGSILSSFRSSSRVNIELGNPNPPAQSLSRQIPIQAGDVVKFFFRERSQHNGFFEYLTDGYGIQFEETVQFGQPGSCRDIELSLRAGLEPTGPPPSIAILPEPDTLAAGGQSLIGLEIAFSNGTKRPFPFLQRFDLELLSGQELGVLRAADSGQTGSSLQQVSGEVWFDAFPGIPQAGQTVQIGAAALLEPYGEISIGAAPEDGHLQMRPAQAASPAGSEASLPMDTEPSPTGIELTGSGEITIQKEDDIQIEIDFPAGNTLWPTLRETVEGNPNNRNRREFLIAVTNHGEPLADFPVNLLVVPSDSSGGHEHTNNRPAGTLSMSFGMTDENGFIGVTYTAPPLGGREQILVLSAADSTIMKSAEVRIRIPGLQELEPGSTYELVGAPQNYSSTNDPCRTSPPASLHSGNHFGSAALVEVIQNIASVFDSLHQGVKLRINDMSLESGGLFDIDINNNWNTPHKSHRVGTNADIGFRAINSDSECTDINLRRLRRIIQTEIRSEPLRETNHFHIIIK